MGNALLSHFPKERNQKETTLPLKMRLIPRCHAFRVIPTSQSDPFAKKLTGSHQLIKKPSENVTPIRSLLLINTCVIDFVANREFGSFRAASRIAAYGKIKQEVVRLQKGILGTQIVIIDGFC